MLMRSPKPEAGQGSDREGGGTSRLRAIAKGLLQAILMLAVLAASYVLMQRFLDNGPERQGRPFQPPVYAVDTEIVARGDYRPSIIVYGQIAAARSVELRAKSAGEIVEVNPLLKAGARVGKGDVLLRIDPFEYESELTEARADLAQARAQLAESEARLASEELQLQSAEEQLALARDDLERAQPLAQRGALTAKQLDERRLVVSQRAQAADQRRSNLAVQEAQRLQQEAAVRRLESRIRRAERALDDTVLTAPFSGIVRSAAAEVGRVASASDVVASLYDDTALEARFTLTDAQYGRIAVDGDPLVGRRVRAVWTVGGRDYAYDGTIDRIGAEILSDRGGVEVFARIDDPGGAVELRPGAFVAITVPDRLYSDAVRLPETAIYDGPLVYAVEEGRLAARPVVVAAYEDGFAIVSEGLEDGTEVMTTHLTAADEGLSVRSAADSRQQEKPVAGRGGSSRPPLEAARAPDRARLRAAAMAANALSAQEWRELPAERRDDLIAAERRKQEDAE